MATRVLNRLNGTKVRTTKTPGTHEDGGGLRLVVSDSGTKRWVVRISIRGRRRELGAGGYPSVSLESARKRATEIRTAAGDGRDITQEHRLTRHCGQTFRQCFETLYVIKCRNLSNKKARLQWRTTMATYVFPLVGDCLVGEVTSGHVLEILEPIWSEKPETARRVLQRMEAVFKSAILRGLRERASPCIGVAQELGVKHRVVVSHRALPYTEVPAFILSLRAAQCRPATRLALEWLILTATRSGDTRLACWSEIDEDKRCWTIPAERAKARRTHMVPLSRRCLEILRETRELHDGQALLFPGTRPGKSLSDMTMTKLMRDARIDAVPHGFRSSFRSWAGDVAKVRREVAEAALAHQIRDKTEAAYVRTTYFEERRALMERWARFAQGV